MCPHPSHRSGNSYGPLRALALGVLLCGSLLCGGMVFGGCGPSLRSSLEVPKIAPFAKRDSQLKRDRYDSYVFVDEFVDSRERKRIVTIEGRDVDPAGDVVEAVVDGLERALSMEGFKFSDTAPIILAGEVRQWETQITGGFTKRAESEAALYVEVLDPANKRVYSGVYRGFAAFESPGLDEEDIRETLRTSMTEAVEQVVEDEQLMRLLAAF